MSMVDELEPHRICPGEPVLSSRCFREASEYALAAYRTKTASRWRQHTFSLFVGL